MAPSYRHALRPCTLQPRCSSPSLLPLCPVFLRSGFGVRAHRRTTWSTFSVTVLCPRRPVVCVPGTEQGTPKCCLQPQALSRRTPPPKARPGNGAEESAEGNAGQGTPSPPPSFQLGDAVVVVEEPMFVKTAEPMPMLRRNSGQVQKGDVGRILGSRPKDVWAVRLGLGAYLIDGKCLERLD